MESHNRRFPAGMALLRAGGLFRKPGPRDIQQNRSNRLGRSSSDFFASSGAWITDPGLKHSAVTRGSQCRG